MNMTQEEIEEYRQSFERFDLDHNNSLDRQEVEQLLQTFMKKPSKAEVEKIFRIADLDQNGTIEFDEFITAMQKIRTDNETEYREIFNAFDTDGNGEIDRGELIQAFNKMGERLSQSEVDTLLEQYDSDKNGVIDFNELCMMMKSLY